MVMITFLRYFIIIIIFIIIILGLLYIYIIIKLLRIISEITQNSLLLELL